MMSVSYCGRRPGWQPLLACYCTKRLGCLYRPRFIQTLTCPAIWGSWSTRYIHPHTCRGCLTAGLHASRSPGVKHQPCLEPASRAAYDASLLPGWLLVLLRLLFHRHSLALPVVPVSPTATSKIPTLGPAASPERFDAKNRRQDGYRYYPHHRGG